MAVHAVTAMAVGGIATRSSIHFGTSSAHLPVAPTCFQLWYRSTDHVTVDAIVNRLFLVESIDGAELAQLIGKTKSISSV